MPARSLADHAVAYLARGWAVVPVQPGGKRPLVRWQEFEQRLPRADAVADWWRRWPDAGIGIVTGAVSGLVVLDIDPRHGGAESLTRLQQRFGSLPQTVEARTGGGGRHLYFAHPDAEVRNRVALAPGIDLRGDGGLVVAPPSLHASGRRYRWVPGGGPEARALARLPDWLMSGPGGDAGLGRSLADWRALVQEGVAEGARNATIASLTGHLLHRGVDPDVILELLLAWNRMRCRPPLDDQEVADVVDSIRRTHLRHSTDAPEG